MSFNEGARTVSKDLAPTYFSLKKKSMFFCADYSRVCLHQDWLRYDLNEAAKDAVSSGDSEEPDSGWEDHPDRPSTAVGMLKMAQPPTELQQTQSPAAMNCYRDFYNNPEQTADYIGAVMTSIYYILLYNTFDQMCEKFRAEIIHKTQKRGRVGAVSVHHQEKGITSGQLGYFPRMHLEASIILFKASYQ